MRYKPVVDNRGDRMMCLMSVTVEHSQVHPSERSEMDESDLEAFSGSEENDDLQVEWSGWKCRCHNWEVQRSVHVTLKRGLAVFAEAGEVN